MVQIRKSATPPETLILPSPEAAEVRVAEIFDRAIRDSPGLVLGLATGGTPVGCYRELVRRHREEGLDFSRVTTFNLDEYVGLPPGHAQSYHRFMREQLFDHVNLDPARTHLPNGLATDPAAHAAAYEEAIRQAGGIDLQLLGIGHNGHIAFNEPGASLDSRTRVVRLREETIEANGRFFDDPADVPRTAVTMGIGTILEARRLVLLATGQDKAEAVWRALRGPIHGEHPASMLRTHPDVTFVLDRAAASKLDFGTA